MNPLLRILYSPLVLIGLIGLLSTGCSSSGPKNYCDLVVENKPEAANVEQKVGTQTEPTKKPKAKAKK